MTETGAQGGRRGPIDGAGAGPSPGRTAKAASGDRWVVLGLAHPRARWFSDLARLATAATIPVDYVKCLSAAEVRARLVSGRAWSALLVGSTTAGLDRDLIQEARQRGAAVIVVGQHPARSWSELGACAVMAEDFERGDLIAVLTEHAPPVARAEAPNLNDGPPSPAAGPDGRWRGRMVAVTGPGGAGSSVAAMALARGLAADASNRGMVLLADLALNADQALLHHSQDVIPALQELVEAHRHGRLRHDQIRSLVFDAAEHGYHLLLGLRRHRDWTAIRHRSLEAALDGLLSSYRLVVADIDPDIEGESETGSTDIEDRNLLARTATRRADVVAVVGTDGVKGIHSLVRAIIVLAEAGVETACLLPVVNRAPRTARRRAETTSALARLLADTTADGIGNPVFMPERRDLDHALRHGLPPAPPLGRTLTAEVRRRLEGAPG